MDLTRRVGLIASATLSRARPAALSDIQANAL